MTDTNKITYADIELMQKALATKSDLRNTDYKLGEISKTISIIASASKRKKWPYLMILGAGFTIGKSWETLAAVAPKIFEALFGFTLPGF